MNQTQNDGITKARLLANIERAGTSSPQFEDNAAYAAHVWPEGGLATLPEYVADSYADQHAGETIEALETRLALALVEPEAGQPAPEPEAPADPLEAAKAAARATINAIVAAKVKLAGPGAVCPTIKGVIQCDSESRINIVGLVVLTGKNPGAFPISYPLADNTMVSISAAEMGVVGAQVAGFVGTVHAHARALKDTINAAPDEAAVAAVDIYAGWP